MANDIHYPIRIGVGKTTLARHLFEHERICAHFGDKKIWVTVEENFHINGLLNKMIESVKACKSELSSLDAIKRKLQEELKWNTLFLVLDDSWNNNEKMQPIHSSMERVGKRIADKCRGVPLAIKVIGGLLRSKPNLHEWESIERSQLWDLPHGHDHILTSLLSFNHLSSPSIKQCFAYFAIIPKGFHAYKSELLGLWLAQGYLRNDTRKNMTLEDIGEEYLKILLSNSLVECVPVRYGFMGYQMHDLVYDLAVYVCGSDLIKEAKDLCDEGSCRHLKINFEANKNTSEFPENALTKLRTLDFKGTVPWTMLIHTKSLRTLFIDRTSITEVSPVIAMLKHLRYLDVSYNPITTLPDSIRKLYQRQTLILQGSIS